MVRFVKLGGRGVLTDDLEVWGVEVGGVRIEVHFPAILHADALFLLVGRGGGRRITALRFVGDGGIRGVVLG